MKNAPAQDGGVGNQETVNAATADTLIVTIKANDSAMNLSMIATVSVHP